MASYRSRTERILQLVTKPSGAPKENTNFADVDISFEKIPILPSFSKPCLAQWEDNININDIPIDFIDLLPPTDVQCERVNVADVIIDSDAELIPDDNLFQKTNG